MYILKNASNEIVGFSDSPFGLSDGQTQEEIPGTVAEYSQNFRLTTDKTHILADGIDAAQVTIHTSLPVASIDVDIDGLIVPIAIAGGIGTLPPIVSQTDDTISVRADDRTLYSAAGEGSLTIIAGTGVSL